MPELHTNVYPRPLDSSAKEPNFQVGNYLWLLFCNMKTIKPRDKLDTQHFGSFVIFSEINDVAFLDFPSHIYLSLVLHVSVLEPYAMS